MNLRDFGNLMRKRLDAMNANREKDTLVIAGDLKALIQLRIQTTGKAYTGATFSPYSASYKETRRKAGAQISYVDFTVTGELWRNIRSAVESSTSDSVTVEITARDKGNIDKLRGALSQPKSSPRGRILTPNEKEISIVQEANKDRVIKYLINA